MKILAYILTLLISYSANAERGDWYKPDFYSSRSCKEISAVSFDKALEQVKANLNEKCKNSFLTDFNKLLTVAKVSHSEDFKTQFNNLLLLAVKKEVISSDQAKMLFNQYFNPKFMAVYNVGPMCISICPKLSDFNNKLYSELQMKSLGLFELSQSNKEYLVAQQLFKEIKLVVSAGCESCQFAK